MDFCQRARRIRQALQLLTTPLAKLDLDYIDKFKQSSTFWSGLKHSVTVHYSGHVLNTELKVRYSAISNTANDLKNELSVHYLSHALNNGPFNN